MSEKKFVIYKEGFDLRQVKETVHGWKHYETPNVVMFHQALPVVTSEEAQIRLEEMLEIVSFDAQSMTESEIPKVHYVDSQSLPLGTVTSASLLDFRPHRNLQPGPELDDLLDDVAKEILVDCSKPVNSRNIVCGVETPQHFHDFPMHISPKFNKKLGPSVGVNIPTGCIGGNHSFTGMHLEEGCLDSCFGCHWGLSNDSVKVWTFVPSVHTPKLSMILSYLVENAKKKNGQSFPEIGSGCPWILGHKNMFVTLNFLKKHEISYEIVVQRPGDIIFVGMGIYHQLINFGVTYAEAVNIGGCLWNAGSHMFTPCICPGSHTGHIPKCSSIGQLTMTEAASCSENTPENPRTFQSGHISIALASSVSIHNTDTPPDLEMVPKEPTHQVKWYLSPLDVLIPPVIEDTEASSNLQIPIEIKDIVHNISFGELEKDKTAPVIVNRQYRHVCPTCGFAYTSRHNMLRHIRAVHQGISCKRTICEVCGKDVRANALRVHQISKSCRNALLTTLKNANKNEI